MAEMKFAHGIPQAWWSASFWLNMFLYAGEQNFKLPLQSDILTVNAQS